MKLEQEENKILEKISEWIKSEIKVQCKHPKSQQDTDPNGVVYCMKYGEDV